MIRRLGPWSGVSGGDLTSGYSSCIGCVLGVDWDDHEGDISNSACGRLRG